MQTLNAQDLADTIAQCKAGILETESRRAAARRNADAELAEPRQFLVALRTQIKDALNAGADEEAEELMRTWAKKHRAYRDRAWRWTQRELSARNSLAELTRQAREARDDLSLLEHCGGRPETYAETYALIEHVTALGKSLKVELDDGDTTMNGAELEQFWGELEPGERIRVLGVVDA